MSMQHLTCGIRELKFAPADSGAAAMSFEGYGAVFGNVDSYGDVIEPGAFAAYLSDVKNGKQKWPAMLLQHGGWGMTAEDLTPIGIWTDLSEDGQGLKVSGTLADTPRGREIYTLLKMERPAIDGLSIGYIAKAFTPRTSADEPRRRLTRIDLVEISPVTFPANDKALVGNVKSGPQIRAIEQALRDVGCSQAEAKRIIAHGYKLSQRDVDDYSELAELIRKNTAVFTHP